MMRESYLGEILPYGKSVIRPKRVQLAFNHNVTANELLPGYEHQVLGTNSSYVFHCRSLINDGVSFSFNVYLEALLNSLFSTTFHKATLTSLKTRLIMIIWTLTFSTFCLNIHMPNK